MEPIDTMAGRVFNYWYMSLYWRGSLDNPKYRLSVADVLVNLKYMQYYRGKVAIRAAELSAKVIKGRRPRKKVNPPKNILLMENYRKRAQA